MDIKPTTRDTGRIAPPKEKRAAQDLPSQATWSRVAQLTLDAYQRHLG